MNRHELLDALSTMTDAELAATVAESRNTGQLDRDAFAGMTPEEIVKAQAEGRFAKLLGATDDEVELTTRASSGVLNPADIPRLASMGRHDLIEQAHTAGRINLESE